MLDFSLSTPYPVPMPRILSLCDNSHIALKPWHDAGFACTAVDIIPAATPVDGIEHVQCDVREYTAPVDTALVLMWPPCTDLARSGAHWWAAKGEGALIRAMEVVHACLRVAGNHPWLMENPIGRLATNYRKPDMYAHPYDFAAYSGPFDAYSKRTCFWIGNGARLPVALPWGGLIDRTRILDAPGGPDRGLRRSVTPIGLARAIYYANRSIIP